MRQLSVEINNYVGMITPLTLPSGGPYYYWPKGQSQPYTFKITGTGDSCDWQVDPVPAPEGNTPLQVDVQALSTGSESPGTMTITFEEPAWSPHTFDVVYYPNADPPLPVPAPPGKLPTLTAARGAPAVPQLLYTDCGACSYLSVVGVAYQHGMRAEVRGGAYRWRTEVVCTAPGTPVFLQVQCLGPLPRACGASGKGQVVVRFLPPCIPPGPPPRVPVFFLSQGCRPPARCRIISRPH